MKTLPPLLLLVHLVACLPGTAATVLTNLGSSELSAQDVRGPAAAGGQIRYGYEFTVDGGDYELDSVTFAMAAPPVFPCQRSGQGFHLEKSRRTGYSGADRHALRAGFSGRRGYRLATCGSYRSE